jgi:hypothetical protein
MYSPGTILDAYKLTRKRGLLLHHLYISSALCCSVAASEQLDCESVECQLKPKLLRLHSCAAAFIHIKPFSSVRRPTC